MAKNYYAILGVLPTATLEEIKSAYRSRVKEFHPDHFGEDSTQFLDVKEAYDILGNPALRTVYDRSHREPTARGAARVRPQPEVIRPRRAAEPLGNRQQFDLGIISPLTSFQTFNPSAEEIFDTGWNSFDLRPQPKAERHRTLAMEVVLTIDQARRGGWVRILIPVRTVCPMCSGAGDQGFFACWECGGTGAAMEDVPLQLEYPPGIQDRYQIAVPLARFGLPDICVVLLFRIDTEGDFADR
jgi:molecular chaperone DnaJ